MNSDFIYWTFSAAAQSISAFFALIFTGYSIVQAILDKTGTQDDTLDEIYNQFRKEYHKKLIWLSILIGGSIIFNLVIVYFNRENNPVSIFLQIICALIDILSIVLGILFVLQIINPNRYEKSIKTLILKDKIDIGGQNSAQLFFESFVNLEKLIRNYLGKKHLLNSQNRFKTSTSFRQMTEILYKNGHISFALYKELLQLNTYRNLVFHGNLETVDNSIIDRTQKARYIFEDQIAQFSKKE
ncbi:MAG: hypothetical protein VB013_04750 [Anaerolineaceae bacterium]|nr:hypothetical protein [Anaerolineaceae bacterium]